MRSLTKNLTKLLDVISNLDCAPDIICLSETKLKDEDNEAADGVSFQLKAIDLEGYEFFCTNSLGHYNFKPGLTSTGGFFFWKKYFTFFRTFFHTL